MEQNSMTPSVELDIHVPLCVTNYVVQQLSAWKCSGEWFSISEGTICCFAVSLFIYQALWTH